MLNWIWLGNILYVNVKQAIEKLEIELLFSQRCQHSWLKRPFSLRNKISNSYSKGFVHKTKRERIEKTVFPYGNRIYIQSCLLKGWEWRWFLRKVRDLKTSLRRRVAKCRGSWVLVWVNVVGKKKFSKKRNLNRKSCKINETLRPKSGRKQQKLVRVCIRPYFSRRT